jgi:hypothetical protein
MPFTDKNNDALTSDTILLNPPLPKKLLRYRPYASVIIP